VSCLSVIHAKGDTRGSRQRGRDTLRKVGPHDTEGVRCTLARFSSVKQGILLGVTPLNTLSNMNQDNVVCYTLTSNIKNDYEYDYVMRQIQAYTIEQVMKTYCRRS
jgi:hypothetical protein